MSFYTFYDKIVREAKAEGPPQLGTSSVDDIVFAAQKTKDPEVYASLETFLKSYKLLGKALRGYWHGRWERAGTGPYYDSTPGAAAAMGRSSDQRNG